jgi:hypothetical protein
MLSRVCDASCNTLESKSVLNTQQEFWFLHVMPRQVIDSESNLESCPSDMYVWISRAGHQKRYGEMQ